MGESEIEKAKNYFFNSSKNYYEVEKVEDADKYLMIKIDGKEKVLYEGIVEWDTTEETIELIRKKEKYDKVYYFKDAKAKRKKTKREQAKIIKFKEDIIKRIPDLIEVEDMKEADIVLIIHNDFTQWDVRENEEVNPRYLEHLKEVMNLSFYWLKRKNQQDDIEKILDYINKEVRRKW